MNSICFFISRKESFLLEIFISLGRGSKIAVMNKVIYFLIKIGTKNEYHLKCIILSSLATDFP